MPAPRLLDKKVLNSNLADQKRREIQAGVALAQKVDAVRQTLSDEEIRLETFRQETIAKVQAEINVKIAELDELKRDIAKRREERIQLEAPIDLKEAWDEVRVGKAEIAHWRDVLTEQAVEQTAKQGDLYKGFDDLKVLENDSKEREKLTERTLQAAEKTFEDASTSLDKAKKESKRLLDLAKKKEMQVIERELVADERDNALIDREQTVNAHELDLASREKALKVRYDTFVKAQAYLKAKSK